MEGWKREEVGGRGSKGANQEGRAKEGERGRIVKICACFTPAMHAERQRTVAYLSKLSEKDTVEGLGRRHCWSRRHLAPRAQKVGSVYSVNLCAFCI